MAYKSKIIEVPEKELFKIDVNRLQLNKPLPFDVYIQESGIYKKFFNKGIVFSNIFLEILKEKNIDSVYIYESEKKQLKAYSSKLLSETALESPIDFKNYSFYKENLYQIERMFLIPGMEVDFSIYLLKNFKITKIVDASPEKLFMIYEDTIPEEGDILIEKRTCLYIRNTLNF